MPPTSKQPETCNKWWLYQDQMRPFSQTTNVKPFVILVSIDLSRWRARKQAPRTITFPFTATAQNGHLLWKLLILYLWIQTKLGQYFCDRLHVFRMFCPVSPICVKKYRLQFSAMDPAKISSGWWSSCTRTPPIYWTGWWPLGTVRNSGIFFSGTKPNSTNPE